MANASAAAPNPRPTEPPLPCVWQPSPSTKVSLPLVRTSVASKLVSVPPKLSRRPPTNWPGYSTACSSTALAMSIKEKPSTKNVTVTGFCVTSSGALLNSASNSLRLAQALANRRLLEVEPAAVTWEDVPRSYEDLLLPKWKGKMGFRDDDYEWYATVLEFMGREKGLQYIRRLAQQQIKFAGDSPLRIQLLCAGEYSLDIGIHFDHPENARKKGCPVNWVVLEPGYKRPPIAIALAKSPPHPSAARIFIDWMLSRDGQKVVTDFTNREPVRADVELGAGVQKLKQFRFWKSNWDSIFLNLDEHQKAYRELFGLK